jgi:hypothetical protein
MYYTPEILLNHVFEDLRKPKAPNTMLVDFLRANTKIFAWSLLDMPSMPRDVTKHSLDIQVGSRLVKPHLRLFDEERRRTIGEEVHKLLVAGFIKEVFHAKWLTNPVLVKKTGGKT